MIVHKPRAATAPCQPTAPFPFWCKRPIAPVLYGDSQFAASTAECKYGNVQYNVSTNQVTRIAVYHHGHEQHGTQHRCKLEDDADYNGIRACSCECATDPAYGGYALASCPTPAPAPSPTDEGYVPTPTNYPTAAPTDAPTATPPCGNGILDDGETCDDGNDDSGDGCSSNCVVEPWYSCQTANQKANNAAGPYCKAWRVRRDINTLSDQEMALYAAAVTALYEQTNLPSAGRSNYLFWVQSHISGAVGPYAHGAPGFLPWHRKYLLEYEKALRAVVVGTATPYANVMIPYFDWAEWSGDPLRTNDMTSGINSGVFGPLRFGGSGTNVLANTGFNTSAGGFDQLVTGGSVSRAHMAYSFGSIPTTTSLITSMAQPNYGTYQVGSETTGHNTVHCAVGGLMCSHASPGDPIFWSHHALIDKHWAVWQDCHDYDEVSTAPAATCAGEAGPLQCKLNNVVDDVNHYNSPALWDEHMPFPNTCGANQYAAYCYNNGSHGGANWGTYDSSNPTVSAKPATWDHTRTTVRQYMKIGDLGADSYMYEMDDLDQELHTQSTTSTLQCNMTWNAFSEVKALADTTHSTHFASSPTDVITQAAKPVVGKTAVRARSGRVHVGHHCPGHHCPGTRAGSEGR